MIKKEYSPSDIESQAIQIISSEVREWEDGQCWITDKIAINMKKVVDRARQNYFGKYSQDRDPGATTDKVFDPITEIMVDTVVHSIDLDPKHVFIKAKNPEHVDFANLARMIIKDYLHRVSFGELLDDVERFAAIDGTAVVKAFKAKNYKTGKNELNTYLVDLRNFYIDPNANNIQDATSVIERAVVSINEFQAYNFNNAEYVTGSKDVALYNGLEAESRGETPMVELYERWGVFEKYLMTGREEDRDVYVDGRIVASSTGGKWVLHEIEENKNPNKYKPYEEWQLKRVPNRWYGRGIAETLFSHQAYANVLANMRKNVNLTKGLGLYEIREGSGIKPSDLRALTESGGIVVKRLGEDIRPFPDRDFHYDQSLNETNQLYNVAQRVTGATELAQGEQLPATTSATSATIQNQNLNTRWDFIKESLGRFVQRVVERHYLPIIKELLSSEEILRIAGDSKFLKDFDERIITSRLNRAIIKYVEDNFEPPAPEQIAMQRELLKSQMRNQGADRFMKNVKEVFNPDFDIEVHVTNEELSKDTQLQNIRDAIANLAQVSPNFDVDALIEDWMDLLGMDIRRYYKKPDEMQQQGMPQLQAQGGGQQPQRQPTPEEVIANAEERVGQGRTL